MHTMVTPPPHNARTPEEARIVDHVGGCNIGAHCLARSQLHVVIQQVDVDQATSIQPCDNPAVSQSY